METTAFTKYHPLVNFIFFIAAIVLTVVIFHPVALAISLVMSVLLAVRFDGRKAIKYFFAFPFVIMLLAMIINPLFVHKGLTVFFYIGESPVTVEALVYGVCTAMMIGAVIMWSYCYSRIMTSDRFMAVFGRIAPSTSLVFSMILRFLPRAKRQAGKISQAQDLLAGNGETADADPAGKGSAASAEKTGSKKSGVRKGIRVTSILTTWALENSIETADSMRARGYGLPGRTNYRKYRYTAADFVAAVIMIGIAVLALAAKATGGWEFFCYPEIVMKTGSGMITGSILMALLYAVPLIIEITEDIRWKRSVSRI